MTDTYPGFGAEYPSGDRLARRRHWLLALRVFLAVAGIGLIFFVLQWSSAVKEEDAPHGPIHNVQAEGEVVVPQYAGGGRGSTLVGLKAWHFGTVEEHPIWFAACVAVLIWAAGAFAACTFWAKRLKRRQFGDADNITETSPASNPPENS